MSAQHQQSRGSGFGVKISGQYILLDQIDDIFAVIDWEYTYAGPAQFVLDPPWWLCSRYLRYGPEAFTIEPTSTNNCLELGGQR